MRRVLSAACALLIMLLGCKPLALTPSATPDEGTIHTRVAQAVASTLTAIAPISAPTPLPTDTRAPTWTPSAQPSVTASHTPTPTLTLRPSVSPSLARPSRAPSRPVTPSPIPVALPPATPPKSAAFPDATYTLQEQHVVGDYALRLWRSSAKGAMRFENVVTIAALGRPTAQIEFAQKFGELTGKDITGEGHPDVIVTSYTGGAHCCSITYVYDLGPQARLVLQTPESNCGGSFKDLDGDGAYEFITCDDSFAYRYCCYASSPAVKVIMQYDPQRGYVPASPRFASAYTADIADHTKLAQQGRPGAQCEEDRSNKCAVLPLVLDYLYSGARDRAWEALGRYYTHPDAGKFRAEIEQIIAASALYVSGS